MKTNVRIKKLIEKRAEKLSKDLINKAEHRADKAEKDYLKQNERREKIYQAKIKYCETLKEKTIAECNNMRAKAERDAEKYLAKARGIFTEMISNHNDLTTFKSVVNIFFKMAQSMEGNVNDYAKRAKDVMQKSENLINRVNDGRELRQ